MQNVDDNVEGLSEVVNYDENRWSRLLPIEARSLVLMIFLNAVIILLIVDDNSEVLLDVVLDGLGSLSSAFLAVQSLRGTLAFRGKISSNLLDFSFCLSTGVFILFLVFGSANQKLIGKL